MFIKYILLSLVFFHLHAENTFKNSYYLDSESIQLKTMIPEADANITLFNISEDRHSKRVSSKELVKILNYHGYKNYTDKPRYINFVLKSPIDTSRIKSEIKLYYEKKYPNINISNITVEPRSYTTSLPDTYIVNIRNKDYLQRNGVINIKTPKNKKIFFNYNISATIDVYVSRKKIKKDVELSPTNTVKKSITLDSLKDKPVAQIRKGMFQTKHHIAQNRVLTVRDIEKLSLIRKKAEVSISLQSDGMDIYFSAKALQNGKLNDIIKVQKSNGKVLKVRVVGKNRAEIQ